MSGAILDWANEAFGVRRAGADSCRGERGSADVAVVWLRLRLFPWVLSDICVSENVVAMLRTAEEAGLRFLRATCHSGGSPNLRVEGPKLVTLKPA